MIRIQDNIVLAPMTTFEIGGPARFFCEARTEEDVREALLWARTEGVPAVVIGGGSNLLVRDEGLDALVIKIVSSKWNVTGKTLEADAGCNLLDLIKKTSALGLGGWEKLSGIPGTVGGAARGNAGAFGTEIQDVVVWVKALNMNTFETREFSRAECEFAYRASFFKKHPEWIILVVHIGLSEAIPSDSARIIRETIREREKRHIQDVRAAGSFFMNPTAPENVRKQFEEEKAVKSREGRVPAGWLIEKAGLKGARVGGAEASEQHPNYLVNVERATASDVRALSTQIKDAVEKQFAIRLQEEAALF